MGEINKIKGNKKNSDKLANRLFMTSITFDVWAVDHKEAVCRLADYLEWVLTYGKPNYEDIPFKKPIPRLTWEATELDPKCTSTTLDNGKDIKL
jgi:hypothetical protein